MRIATWNVNSIRARLPRLLAWLESSRPDVVCLQETKVEDAVFPSLELRAAGWEIATVGQRTYNGVAILSREPIVDVARGMEDGVEDPQARFLAGTVRGVRVVSVYVPNGQAPGTDKFQYKLEWLARLRRWLEARHDTASAMAVLGDFNVAPEPLDVHDPAEWEGTVLFCPEVRAAFRELLAWGLEDLYRKHHAEGGRYTWWDYRRLAFPQDLGLRIDHALATSSVASRCSGAEIDRVARKGKGASDHAPLVVEIDAPES